MNDDDDDDSSTDPLLKDLTFDQATEQPFIIFLICPHFPRNFSFAPHNIPETFCGLLRGSD